MSVKQMVARTRSGSGAMPSPGQELLDLSRYRLGIDNPGQMVGAGKLNILGARDLLGEEAAVLDGNPFIVFVV
jgi:hypothetical protein